MVRELVAKSGRIYIRDDNLHGTIMVYKQNDVEKKMLILDGNYRFTSIYCRYNQYNNISCYKDGYYYLGATENNRWIDPNIVSNADGFTDQFLDSSLLPTLAPSSTETKQSLLKDKSIDQVSAILKCNNFHSIPTINQLARIYCDREIIDSLDKSNQFRLTDWFDNLVVPFAWSCTQNDWYYNWCILSSGLVGGSGKCDVEGGVIPIIEMDV